MPSARWSPLLTAIIRNPQRRARIDPKCRLTDTLLIEENEKGRSWFNKVRAQEQEQLLERVGAELREMIPFLNPVRIKPGE